MAKKKEIFLGIILIILVVVLVILLINLKPESSNKSKELLINIEYNESGTDDYILYDTYDGRNVYAGSRMSSLTVKIDNEFIDFKDMLALYGIDKLETIASNTNYIKDGGSKVYTFNSDIASQKFNIVACHNYDGNTDIYIDADIETCSVK